MDLKGINAGFYEIGCAAEKHGKILVQGGGLINRPLSAVQQIRQDQNEE